MMLLLSLVSNLATCICLIHIQSRVARLEREASHD